jgi:hypothetical protein
MTTLDLTKTTFTAGTPVKVGSNLHPRIKEFDDAIAKSIRNPDEIVVKDIDEALFVLGGKQGQLGTRRQFHYLIEKKVWKPNYLPNIPLPPPVEKNKDSEMLEDITKKQAALHGQPRKSNPKKTKMHLILVREASSAGA